MQKGMVFGEFSVRVEELMRHLTKQEKKVVDFILSHKDEIIHLSITDLAMLSKASESTITRLCVKLGYGGFQAMKISIAQEIVTPRAKIHEGLTPTDSTEQIIAKVFDSASQAILMTRDALSSPEIKRSIDVLEKASKIIVVGSGNSGSIAMDAHHKFLRIGLNAVSYTDEHMQMIAVSSAVPTDVIIGISHSGSSLSIRDALQYAKGRGATTISITSYGVSPISRLSDIRLYTRAQETKYRTYAISSRLATLAIIDTLYTGLSLRREEETVANFERVEEALSVKKF